MTSMTNLTEKEYKRQWYLRNKKKILEKAKKRYSENKESIKDYKKNHYKTLRGLVQRKVSHMKQSSKVRGHEPPNFDKYQLEDWMKIQPNFEVIWRNWVDSNYSKELVPSCDRLENSKGYTLDNLQLVPWYVNNKNGNITHKQDYR